MLSNENIAQVTLCQNVISLFIYLFTILLEYDSLNTIYLEQSN